MGVLVFQGVVQTLGTKYINRLLAAQSEIADLQAAVGVLKALPDEEELTPILGQVEADAEKLEEETKGLDTMADDILSTMQGIEDLEATVTTWDDQADNLVIKFND